MTYVRIKTYSCFIVVLFRDSLTGLVLNDMGLEKMLDALLQTYIQPLVRHVLSACTAGFPVDSHHSFVVEYDENRDRKLDMHTDDSDGWDFIQAIRDCKYNHRLQSRSTSTSATSTPAQALPFAVRIIHFCT